MQNNNNENRLFIEACKKAGLKVQKKEMGKVADGLVVVDDCGHRYTVTSDAQIQKIEIKNKKRISPLYRAARLNSTKSRNVQSRGSYGCKVANRSRTLKKQEK